LQDAAQLRHDPIPGFGTEPFVEIPQLVDVEQDETEGEGIPPGSLELFLQSPVERIEITAPCEHIDREGAGLAPRGTGTSLLALQQPGGRLQHLLGETNLISGKVRIRTPSPKQKHPDRPAAQRHRQRGDALHIRRDAELCPEGTQVREERMSLEIRDKDRSFGAQRLDHFRVAAEVHSKIPGGRTLAHRDNAPVPILGTGHYEGAPGQLQGETDATHQSFEDFVAAGGGRQISQELEHQLLTPERPLSLVVGRAAPEASGDPRIELGKVDRAGENVVGTGLERQGDGFRIRITEQDDARNPLPRHALEPTEKGFEHLVRPMDGDEAMSGARVPTAVGGYRPPPPLETAPTRDRSSPSGRTDASPRRRTRGDRGSWITEVGRRHGAENVATAQGVSS
jgi:hypothetical protein